MRDKKKLPKGLAEKQEFQRQETINKVLRAITDIKNEGRKVTISTLMEFTMLSRSTLSKPHIRGLLVEYGYSAGDSAKAKPENEAKKRVDVMVDKNRQIAELRAKNAELEKECELLRGRLLLMMQKLNLKE